MLDIHHMVPRSPATRVNRLFLETSREHIISPQITANAQKYCPSLCEARASKRGKKNKKRKKEEGECRREMLFCRREKTRWLPLGGCAKSSGDALCILAALGPHTHSQRQVCVITALQEAASWFPKNLARSEETDIFFFCTEETMSCSPASKCLSMLREWAEFSEILSSLFSGSHVKFFFTL